MQAQLLALAQRYLLASWQHRWKALALAWLVCLIGWFGVYSMPDRYEARARVFADTDAVLSQILRGISIDSSAANQVELLQRTLLSRPNLERVIARTDLDLRIDSVAAREDMLRRLPDEIRFVPQGRNLFSITYTDHDPRVARSVVQTVLDLFIEQATNNDRQQMESARAFLNQQIATYEAQLREAEQRRADFRGRYLELLPEGASGATGLEMARARLRQLRGELTDLQQRRIFLRQQLEATPAVLAPGEAGGPGGESRLAEAERTLRELRLRFTEQHPDVVAARNVVAELRAAGPAAARPVAPAPRPGGSAVSRANPLYEQVRLRLVDVDAEIASHERQMREAEADIIRLEATARTMPQVQAEYLNLDRDYAILRRNYEELLARREAVQIAGAARTNAERVRLEVVDPPVLPSAPIGPNRLLFTSAVLLVGFGAGAALALLLGQLDSSFYNIRDLRALGLPVLGSVSVILPPRRGGLAIVGFGAAVALLICTYAVVLTGGRELLAKVPEIVARIIT